MLRSLLQAVRESLAFRPADAIVNSSADFARVLERECSRVDRTNGELCVTLFQWSSDGGRATRRLVIQEVAAAKRISDHLGWIADGRLAVALPDTGRAGAEIFGDRIRECLADRVPSLRFRVHVYPSDFFADFSGYDREVSGKVGSHAAGNGGPDRAQDRPLPTGSRIPVAKRVLDVAGATLALVALSPVLLLVAAVIKAGSRGPVLFKQARIGLHGKPFVMWKFRTLELDPQAVEDHRGHVQRLISTKQPMQKLSESLPTIPLGGVLRATYADELPQLFNVLRGEMSLVGPRPCLPYEATEYQRWQWKRFQVLPGMTGVWQVGGKNRTTFEEMVRMDIRYSRRRSSLVDIFVLMKTVPTILGELGQKARGVR